METTGVANYRDFSSKYRIFDGSEFYSSKSQEEPRISAKDVCITFAQFCITFLYTVIPNGEGLLALKHFFDQRAVKEPKSEALLRLAELVLTLNCFSFGDNFFKQTNGVAMGTKMGPSYANLFVGFVEHQFFSQYNGPKPQLYGRYIDDCIGATSSTREELTEFITADNSFHPALKYTWEISDDSLSFLDIKVSIEGNGLCTSVYYKPTRLT